MSGADLSAIHRAMSPTALTREQHDEFVSCLERRFLRADEKLANAATELNEAREALKAGRAARAQFIADNPDAQLAMPFEAQGE